MSNAIQKSEPQQSAAIVAINDNAALMAAVARAASDPNVDVEKMERLFAMHERMEARQAEVAFNAAMSKVQAEMRRIATDKTNSQTHSNYATYGALDRKLRPLYTAEGLSLSFDTETAAPEVLRVICFVSHVGGHTRRYSIDMPADGKGAKGGDVMTKTHATGSAASYGMRYLLKMIFNVALGDDPDDDDGNGAGGEAPLGDWPDAIGAAVDKVGLKKLKAEMVTHFGGQMKIPAALIRAYNLKWESVQ